MLNIYIMLYFCPQIFVYLILYLLAVFTGNEMVNLIAKNCDKFFILSILFSSIFNMFYFFSQESKKGLFKLFSFCIITILDILRTIGIIVVEMPQLKHIANYSFIKKLLMGIALLPKPIFILIFLISFSNLCNIYSIGTLVSPNNEKRNNKGYILNIVIFNILITMFFLWACKSYLFTFNRYKYCYHELFDNTLFHRVMKIIPYMHMKNHIEFVWFQLIIPIIMMLISFYIYNKLRKLDKK